MSLYLEIMGVYLLITLTLNPQMGQQIFETLNSMQKSLKKNFDYFQLFLQKKDVKNALNIFKLIVMLTKPVLHEHIYL